MRERIQILRRLLQQDGFFCCHIDDSEGAYLKVVLDEIFGRENYLTTFYIQVRYPEKTLKQDMAFHKEIEQIHIYRRDYGAQPNQNETTASFDKFCYYITEKGSGQKTVLGGKEVVIFKPDEYIINKAEGSADGLKEIWASGTILDGNSSGRFFRDYLAGRAELDGLGVLYKVASIGFFTEFCGWGGRVVRKRRDGSTRSNSLRTLWKNARTYRRLEGLRGGFATGRQALGVALGLGEERGDLPGMWCEHEPA
jgi:hypothetical protein